ncbi:MAG: Na+/H+ antiporter NhaA [Sphingomonadaceae bacterium]
MITRLTSRSALMAFLAGEATSGLLLIAAAALALILVNSGADGAHLYHLIVDMRVGEHMTVHHIINDGLMALFFLLVGLEIKREFLDGRLSDWGRRILPAIAAAAGMALPAFVYLTFAGSDPTLVNGWAIPAATDIAFALGVLALLGSRAPTALKLLLTTIAIMDDVGAVIIIAFFYTSALNWLALGSAAAIFALMWGLNRRGIKSLAVYLLLAIALWAAVLLSGVHATIAGVLAALTIPIRTTPGTPDATDSPLHRLEHGLHPWSAYLIVPLFGFANAGVELGGLGVNGLLAPLPLAVAAGLVLGKQVGIFSAIWLSVRTGVAQMPRGATWAQLYGMSLLCGIGFTMSLFIGALAFPTAPELVEESKIGILVGSLISAVMGFILLRLAPLHPQHSMIEAEQSREIEADGDVST